MHDTLDIAAVKQRLRLRLAAARGVEADVSGILCARLLDAVESQEGERVACVWPLPGEVDLRPLCGSLHARGREILLPETTPKGTPLVFRQWMPGQPMKEGRFGTLYPDGPVEKPDLILVPLLAFDRRGHRLGYGGGYYDRTLAAFPHALPVGYAASWQEVEEVPTGPHDVPLPMIVTERETVFSGQG